MATYNKNGEWEGTPIVKTPKKTGGKGPRRSGDRVERIVAKDLGGTRTPMSGAVKNSNHNLTGDVEVADNEGKPFIKLEVKASGILTTTGEKSYVLKKAVLDQMVREAEEAGELGALFLHFKGQNIDDGYIMMQNKHWKEIVELAKLGRTVLKGK